jgi:hypothetical protein
MKRLLFAVLAAGLLHGADLHEQFLNPPDDCRIMMRWWWFGPAVTHAELARELRVMHDAGIGGVEIQPVYPLELLHNLPYLVLRNTRKAVSVSSAPTKALACSFPPCRLVSEAFTLSNDFLEAVNFANETARALGMRVDITLGSGWPYGGPHIPVTLASSKLRIVHGDEMPALEDGESLIAAFPNRHVYFIASRTGQQVKRAGVGAEGFVLDHFDRAAIELHLHTVGDRLMAAFGTHPPYAVFSDSLEAYGADWTPDFLAQFEKRRGYDLKPLLPELETNADVRHDWALTLTELAEQNYLTPIREWAHAHHTLFRSQTYGEPVVRMSSGRIADLSEGEAGPKWRVFNAARWAASTNHIYGRNVTSTETWTWLHAPSFRATPLDMKAEADLHFIEGVNQLIGHGWPYSPRSAGEPGWRFYAAAAFNDHNPWFQVMPYIAKYLQRVSFLMRQGEPVNDVAVYLPTDDALAASMPGHVSIDREMEARLGPDLIPQILNAGFNFDYVDDLALAQKKLPYKVIILPGVERISAETLQRLQSYPLIAMRRRPDGAANIKLVEDEHQLGQELRKEITPDLQFSSDVIGFAHRKMANRDIYFVVNTSNSEVKTRVKFRVSGNIEEWNPFDGSVRGFSELDLAPYESEVFVIGGPPRVEARMAASKEVVADLSTDWQTDKEGLMPVLKPWSDEFYSGKVSYTKLFKLDGESGRLWLDFGEGTKVEAGPMPNGMRALLESPVRESALVYVNGSLAGAVWHPPYQVEVTKFVHAGSNELEVVVANLAINEMAGKPLPDYRLLSMRYGERFVPQGFEGLQALPAGMLGAVKLIRQ